MGMNCMKLNFSLNRIKFLSVLYVVFAFVLIYSAAVLQRNYQDSWILEGLEIQLVLVSVPFLLLATSLKSSKKLVLVVASFLILLSIVPNLKYVQITGVFDSIAHSGYANRIIASGYVPETGFYSKEYSATPGMHIFLSSLTLITGLSLTNAIKLLLVTVSALPPFILYLLLKNSFNEKSKRFIFLAMVLTLPVASALFGTTFALPLFFMFIAIFLRQTIDVQAERGFSVILIIISVALIFSHGVTPLFLTVLMVFTPIVLKMIEIVRNEKFSFKISRYLQVAIFLVIFLSMWWAYNADYLFNNFLVRTIQSIFSIQSSNIAIPSTFFTLSFSEQLTLAFIRFYDLAIALGLGLLGILFYFVFRKGYSKGTKDLYLQFVSILIATGLISIPFFFNLFSYTFERFITYANLLSPIFIGLALFGIYRSLGRIVKKISTRNILFTIFLFILFIPLLFVIFSPQPIVPKNSDNEYLVDYRSINTNYQMSMIQFAEKYHVNGSIVAADTVTSWQIFGLTGNSFYFDYIWENPLYANETTADIILLHYSGVAGPLNEKIDYRSRINLNGFKFDLGNSIVYDNGESFVIVPQK